MYLLNFKYFFVFKRHISFEYGKKGKMLKEGAVIMVMVIWAAHLGRIGRPLIS